MTAPEPRVWEIVLRWNRPPLSANQRLHWRKEARLKREVREAAHFGAKCKRIPALARCRVELVYVQPDRRRRDADNPFPTLKAAADGLVDAHVVPDDTPAYMDKRTPILMPPDGSLGRLVLVITELPAQEGI